MWTPVLATLNILEASWREEESVCVCVSVCVCDREREIPSIRHHCLHKTVNPLCEYSVKLMSTMEVHCYCY